MKLTSVLSFVLAVAGVSANATRLGGYELVKALDGGAVNCAEPSDVGRRGYWPTDHTVTSDGLTLQVNLAISSIVCRESQSGRGWSAGLFMEPYTQKDLQGRDVRYIPQYQDFILVGPSYDILAKEVLSRTSSASLSANPSLSSILTSDDYRALGRGETVRKRLEFFLRTQSAVETPEGTIQTGLVAGGGYVLLLDFVRDARTGVILVRPAQN